MGAQLCLHVSGALAETAFVCGPAEQRSSSPNHGSSSRRDTRSGELLRAALPWQVFVLLLAERSPCSGELVTGTKAGQHRVREIHLGIPGTSRKHIDRENSLYAKIRSSTDRFCSLDAGRMALELLDLLGLLEALVFRDTLIENGPSHGFHRFALPGRANPKSRVGLDTQ